MVRRLTHSGPLSLVPDERRRDYGSSQGPHPFCDNRRLLIYPLHSRFDLEPLTRSVSGGRSPLFTIRSPLDLLVPVWRRSVGNEEVVIEGVNSGPNKVVGDDFRGQERH